MSKIGLEELKEIFTDDKLHVKVGKIVQMEVAADRSVLRCMVLILPDNLKMVARMSWEAVGPDAGIFQFPSIDDMVVLCFIDGHEQDAFILKRLTSTEEKIPVQALDGHLVLAALPGKKNLVLSDTEIQLSRTGAGAEPLVLGQTFKTAYSAHLAADIAHTHIGNLGYPTDVPINIAAYQAIKNSPVDNSNMLSDIAKTEK